MQSPQSRWVTPLIWRLLLRFASVAIPLLCRLRVTGDVPDAMRGGPLVLAGNHIGNYDPPAHVAACARRRIAPRMMATGGLFRAPLFGWMMRASGHIPVHRGRADVGDAVAQATEALRHGSVVFIYPEGRIGLDPAMWPERPKTGLARMALATGAPVVPVAVWGTHEVIAYHGAGAMARTAFTALFRRPVVRVHFGEPVDLSDLRIGDVGAAQRASDRIMDAITEALAPLREHELRLPRHVDHTRPLSTARVRRPARRP
ncbi:lysophospholipid acyltransferase family protein [Luedemannella flava]|uniref:Lysophospholipid acyltransferase family protein n=1 Tax=Luedemannella flava TaxID=349316 RepID=A0ABP4Z072_9ACTN